jgi:shikimate dehydrogenase
MTNRVGIIGYPLGHSFSPIFQQAAIDYCGLDAVYEAWATPLEGLDRLLAWLRETPDIWGANVTVPHKEAVAERVDELDAAAEPIGAVNTIVVRDGRLIGHNTDLTGFLRALRQYAGFDPKGKRVLVLGAGGASRAVVAALVQSKAAQVTIANRTLSRALALAGLAAAGGIVAKAVGLDDASLFSERAKGDWDLIVNTTSMGMRHGAAETYSPMPAALIPAGALVYDLVYNPSITPLLEAAQAAGAIPLSGLSMLVYQGAGAFSLWTGIEAPVETMMAAARQALDNA